MAAAAAAAAAAETKFDILLHGNDGKGSSGYGIRIHIGTIILHRCRRRFFYRCFFETSAATAATTTTIQFRVDRNVQSGYQHQQ